MYNLHKTPSERLSVKLYSEFVFEIAAERYLNTKKAIKDSWKQNPVFVGGGRKCL